MPEAIVLAGRRSNHNAYPEEFSSIAQVNICGKPMLYYVIKALRESKLITRIIVCGDSGELKSVLACFPNLIFTKSGENMLETLYNGIDALENKDSKALVVTGDIPLLTTEAVNDFLNNCNLDFDVFYPIVDKKLCEIKYPNVKRTYVKLKEGFFTGGNLLFFNPKIILKCEGQVNILYSLRKSPIKLANKMGFSFIIKYLLGMVSLVDVEDVVAKTLGIQGKGVITNYPEIGVDVDKPSDLELVRKKFCS